MTDKLLTITLTEREAMAIRAALKLNIRRLRADDARNTFVPEPGRIDVVKARLQSAESALRTIRRVVPEKISS